MLSHVTAFGLAAWDLILRYPGIFMFLFGLFVTALLRKRSAEEFAAMPPRRAAAIRFVQGLLPDAPKLIETVGLFVTGRVPVGAPPPKDPPKDPPSPPFLPLLCLALTLAALSGCTPGASDPSRNTARGFVLLTADAVHTADHFCAEYALAKKDPALAKKCADDYDTARPSLLAAEAGIDAYANKGGPVLCSVGASLQVLAHIAEALTAAGATLPPVIVDALALSKGLVCHV